VETGPVALPVVEYASGDAASRKPAVLLQGDHAAIRRWRLDHDHGTQALDEFVVGFNEALGNHIDERTSRRLRLRGGVVVSLKDTVKR